MKRKKGIRHTCPGSEEISSASVRLMLADRLEQSREGSIVAEREGLSQQAPETLPLFGLEDGPLIRPQRVVAHVPGANEG